MMNDARKMFEAKNYSIRGKDTIHSVEKMTEDAERYGYYCSTIRQYSTCIFVIGRNSLWSNQNRRRKKYREWLEQNDVVEMISKHWNKIKQNIEREMWIIRKNGSEKNYLMYEKILFVYEKMVRKYGYLLSRYLIHVFLEIKPAEEIG